MQDSNHLLNQVQQEIEASSKTSPTEAGPAETKPSVDHVDALNEVFALFRINYHNQYYKAYTDSEVLAQIKKLWLDSLKGFTPDIIRRGARKVIETSDYLPTLNRMIKACQGEPRDFGLKEAHAAYVEACQAPSPKAAYQWSHPAVYYAGLESDWFFLASNPERLTYPVFAKHYARLCEQVIQGETLPPPDAPALPKQVETPLSKEENRLRMAALKKTLHME